MQKRNSIVILISLVIWFFTVAFLAIPRFFGTVFGKKQWPIRENKFLDVMNFLAHSWPKSFWKKPTGLKIGRSVSTLLHYIFDKETRFSSIEPSPKKAKTSKNAGFTLIEMIVSITLFSALLIAAFSAFGNIGLGKVRVNNALDLNKDMYFAVEKVAALIKDGGAIDYEEYWNRKATGTATSSGHYQVFSAYGNSGSLYSCTSDPNPVGTMGSNGCLISGTQKYGEYKNQFIDTGSGASNDDDEDLGTGPEAFTSGVALPELYLINRTKLPHERLLFRLNVKKDPGNLIACDGTPTNSGCISNIQVLKLSGKDTNNDGKTDAWVCNKDYCPAGNGPVDGDAGWVDVLPDYINVKSLQFYVSPSKDVTYAWKESAGISAPYVRVAMRIGFSAARRKTLKWADPEVSIATTINLE